MPDALHIPRPRMCPHCGKDIPRLAKTPRDLALLLHFLLYRVEIELEVTEERIEMARIHCKMKPERLTELRSGDHARHWPRMLERRAARLAFFRPYGELPPRWIGLLPGEPDHYAALEGMRRYRKQGLAKMKARLRKHPISAGEKLNNRYMATKRIRSVPRRSAALDDVLARLVAQFRVQVGKLTLKEYEELKALMLAEDALPRRFRRKLARIGCPAEIPPKNASGEDSLNVPQQDTQS